jgi:hypothetical protein
MENKKMTVEQSAAVLMNHFEEFLKNTLLLEKKINSLIDSAESIEEKEGVRSLLKNEIAQLECMKTMLDINT